MYCDKGALQLTHPQAPSRIQRILSASIGHLITKVTLTQPNGLRAQGSRLRCSIPDIDESSLEEAAASDATIELGSDRYGSCVMMVYKEMYCVCVKIKLISSYTEVGGSHTMCT